MRSTESRADQSQSVHCVCYESPVIVVPASLPAKPVRTARRAAGGVPLNSILLTLNAGMTILGSQSWTSREFGPRCRTLKLLILRYTPRG